MLSWIYIYSLCVECYALIYTSWELILFNQCVQVFCTIKIHFYELALHPFPSFCCLKTPSGEFVSFFFVSIIRGEQHLLSSLCPPFFFSQIWVVKHPFPRWHMGRKIWAPGCRAFHMFSFLVFTILERFFVFLQKWATIRERNGPN